MAFCRYRGSTTHSAGLWNRGVADYQSVVRLGLYHVSPEGQRMKECRIPFHFHCHFITVSTTSLLESVTCDPDDRWRTFQLAVCKTTDEIIKRYFMMPFLSVHSLPHANELLSSDWDTIIWFWNAVIPGKRIPVIAPLPAMSMRFVHNLAQILEAMDIS